MGNFSQAIDARLPRAASRTPLVKAGAYAGGANITQVVFGFIATALLARFLGPEQKGVYDLYVATSMLFTVALSMALNSGVTYVVASQPVNSGRLMRVLALIAGAEGVAALGVMYLGQLLGIGHSFVPVELGRWGTLAITGTIVLLSMSTFYRAVLLGHREFVAASCGDIGKQGTTVVFILVAFASARYLQAPLVTAMVIANMAAVGVATAGYGWQVPSTPALTSDIGLKRAFRFALPSYFASTTQYLNNRIDLFFVYHYWGPADVGLYQTAVLIAQAINLLPTAMQGILFPTISSAERSREEVVDLVVRVHRLLFAFSAIVAGSLAGMGPFIIPLIFGKRFAASAVSLALLAPGCAVFATTNVLAAYFAGTGRPHINLINSLIGTGVTIGLDLAAVPRFSFYGASVVSSLSYTATTIGSLAVFYSETGVSLRKLFLPVAGDWALVRQYCRRVINQINGAAFAKA